jgi:hypothetical protein
MPMSSIFQKTQESQIPLTLQTYTYVRVLLLGGLFYLDLKWRTSSFKVEGNDIVA